MYKLIEVGTPEEENQFFSFPKKLYKDSRFWIAPLEGDYKAIFDKEKNPLFKTGEMARWVLLDGQGACIGRIAAFINGKTAHLEEYFVGQIGFFECIDDEKAAFMLFDVSKEWLLKRGVEAIEGPVNFGERMEWWGLLTRGFDEYPVYAMPYNPEYYVRFFEDYGFRNYYNQYTFRTRLVDESLSKIVIWKADRILRDPDYMVVTFDEIGEERAINSIMAIYNKAWNLKVHGVDGVDMEEIRQLYSSLKMVIDKKLLYFAFYKNEPIGFFLMFPEMNHVFRKLDGRINLMGMLKLLYALKCKKIDVALGELFGVVPEFQNKGVEAAMIKKFYDNVVVQKSHYRWLELNWLGDFNPPMVHLMDYIGGKLIRVHVTYRKLLKEGINFERAVDRMNRLSRQ